MIIINQIYGRIRKVNRKIFINILGHEKKILREICACEDYSGA